jgi:hypothetical protein
VAPSIEILGGYIGANKGLILTTKDGQNFLVCPNTDADYKHQAIKLKSVDIDGNVYIVSGEGVVNLIEGGKIDGYLLINSKGNVGINYQNNGKTLEVTGNLVANADGKANILRKTTVGKNLDMSNSGGYVEIVNSHIKGDANLKAEYIKKDIEIFGITGTCAASDEASKDLTATANDILNGKTALVKGEVIEGTINSIDANT